MRGRSTFSSNQTADGQILELRHIVGVVLGIPEQDPLYKLPARKLLGGMYVELGTVNEEPGQALKTGQVLKSYL